jgi:hypothetical protein
MAGAASEVAFTRPRVPYPIANAFADAVRAANDNAAHSTEVWLRVTAEAVREAAFAHPCVPYPFANALVDAVRAGNDSAAHGYQGVTVRRGGCGVGGGVCPPARPRPARDRCRRCCALC